MFLGRRIYCFSVPKNGKEAPSLSSCLEFTFKASYDYQDEGLDAHLVDREMRSNGNLVMKRISGSCLSKHLSATLNGFLYGVAMAQGTHNYFAICYIDLGVK